MADEDERDRNGPQPIERRDAFVSNRRACRHRLPGADAGARLCNMRSSSPALRPREFLGRVRCYIEPGALMLIRTQPGTPSSEITDERWFLRRRDFIRVGAGLIGTAAGGV